MSLDACIPDLVAKGEMTPEQGEEMKGLYDTLTAQYRREHDQDTAAALATEQTLKVMEENAKKKRELAGRTIKVRQRQAADLMKYDGGQDPTAPIDPRAGPAMLRFDDKAPYENVEGLWGSIRGRVMGMIDQALTKFSTNVAGFVRNRATLMDLVREAFGEDSGNVAAKQMFEAWRQAAEYLRQRFNAAGGNIAFLKDWGLPQVHVADKIRRVTKADWIEYLMGNKDKGIPGRLDREKMIDERTGRPIADDDLHAALDKMRDRILSGGAIDHEPGDFSSSAILANTRDDARFLKFASAADWADYADKFGNGDAFRSMMLHINSMARDIAFMEILGPNPEAGLRFIKDTLRISATKDLESGLASHAARAAGKKMDREWAELTGENRFPEKPWMAQAGAIARAWQVSTKLGSAVVTALTDTAFQFQTRAYNGLPVVTMIPQYLKYMTMPGARDAAIRAGLIGDAWRERISAGNAALGEEMTGEVARRLATGVIRASGLNLWTDAGRFAMGEEILSALARKRDLTFDKIGGRFRRMLERYGIDAEGWDAIRATPLVRDRGANWLRPGNVANGPLGDRLLSMIGRETNMAVPTPDVETRAMLNAVPPGTFMGEFVRMETQFRGFGISAALMQWNRIMAQSAASRALYIASLAGATTTVGAIVNLLQDLIHGRDPDKAFDSEGRIKYDYWGAAFLTGGGFGIVNDFLRSFEGDMGTLDKFIVGAGLGDFKQLLSIPKGGPFALATREALAATGRGPKGAEAVMGHGWQGRMYRLARSNVPMGSMWYYRLGFDRMIADRIQMAADPNYMQSFIRIQKGAFKQGNQYYWAPGQPYAASRAPDFANIGKPAKDPEKLFGLK